MSHVLHPFHNPRIISVCTGMGGLERGLQRAIGPINPVAYLEIETFIIENLLSLMEQGVLHSAPVWADATTFPAEQFHNKVHGIAGGYPCQGESVAGNMAGQKDRRFIWWSIERIIKAVNPIWCFFENVSNHLNVSYPIVQRSLRNLGYRVEESICSAEEAGAPHGRKRIFILAVKLEHSQSGGRRGLQNTARERQRYGASRPSGISRRNQELGNSEHHGLHGQPQQGSHGTGSANAQKRPNSTEQPSGTDRPGNERGICSELADTNGTCSGRKSGNISGEAKETKGETRQQNGQRLRHEPGHGSSPELANKKLGYSSHERLQGSQFNGAPEKNFIEHQPHGTITQSGFGDRWPAPPGPYQHEWEAPRAEGNAHRLPPSLRTMWSKGRKNFAKMLGEEVWRETDHYLQAATQSSLGSTINGYNFREDLLRMYGNGVVEQQAEIAIRILLEKHGIPLPF